MPRVIDKLLLNHRNADADAYTLDSAFEAGIVIAKEFEQFDSQHPGLANKAHRLFTPQQEAICEAHAKYMADSIAAQRKLNDDMRRWLDNQLGANGPVPTP